MKYPVRKTAAEGRLHVAALDGGINRRDAAHLLDDRQLADAENVWWRDGALRMRPAFQAQASGLRVVSAPLTLEADSCTLETVATGCIASHDGVHGEYVAAIRHLSGTAEGYAAEYEISLLLADGTRIDTDTLLVKDGNVKRNHQSLLIVQNNNSNHAGTFAFIEGGRIYRLEHTLDTGASSAHGYWKDISNDGTIPTVMTGGRGYSSQAGSKNDASGTVLRSFNLLTKEFVAEYTTDGCSNCFVLPLKHQPESIVSVTYMAQDGSYLARSVYGLSDSFTFDGFTVTMTVEGNTLRFMQSGQPFYFPESSVANNLSIIATYSDLENVPRHNVFAARVSTWFGGAGGGLTGGSRWFVGGGKDAPGMIFWSALDNPLDFPANNYATVGKISEEVTAFAKQSDMLVIFKERSLYHATYAAQTVNVNDVLNGGVTDIESASALFPIKPLHAFIGCDCPQTIALCDNRLVWATSQKRIYTLTAANPFSECNVLELSDLIRGRLTDITADEMKAAVACDYDGYYLLLAGTRAAALYYGKGSFGSVSSYSAAKRAGWVWYYWSFPETNMRPVHALNIDGEPVLLAECAGIGVDGEPVVRWATVRFGNGPDTTVDVDGTIRQTRIRGFVQTKQFDFNRPDRLKRLVRIYPETETGGHWVWITDHGERDGHIGEDQTVIVPQLPATARFGMRISFSGVFALAGITMIYQLWGERKE